jgi:hypothetical protein
MPKQLELNIDISSESPIVNSKSSPERQWLLWAAQVWHELNGGAQQKMTVRWARDLALIRPLLRLHGEQELKLRWQAYVTTVDEYFARRGWDVPSFSFAIDRYRGNIDLAPIIRRRQLILAEANDRDPLTGASLRR